MADEKAPEGEEQQQEEQKNRAQDRIQELARRNAELENIVNMQKRLENVEGTTVQVAQGVQQIQQNQQKSTQPEDPWTPFMKPKVAPIMEEYMAPVRQGFMVMADRIDYLTTLQNHPEYKDSENQQMVEEIRVQRQRAGQPESRENIIIYLKGLGKIKAPKGEQSGETEREEKASKTFVETSSGVGTSRAATKLQKSAEESSIEEMEKFMAERQMKF